MSRFSRPRARGKQKRKRESWYDDMPSGIGGGRIGAKRKKTDGLDTLAKKKAWEKKKGRDLSSIEKNLRANADAATGRGMDSK